MAHSVRSSIIHAVPKGQLWAKALAEADPNLLCVCCLCEGCCVFVCVFDSRKD